METRSLSCDVLVIGSGAGGASVAATLAEAGRDVLLLEEGPYFPIETAPTCLTESMPSLWRGGGLTATLGDVPIAFAEGRCVGGGTEINSAIFQRAPETVLQGWSRATGFNSLWSRELVPYYERAESIVSASLIEEPPGPPTAILNRAARAMNWETTSLKRARVAGRISRQRISGFATGAKQSMTATLIPRALRRGARLLPNCKVTRLRHDGRRVLGADGVLKNDDRRCRVRVVASHVFLCAGTTQTPVILQRSRVRCGAGLTFQLHPTLRLLARFPEEINAHRHHLPLVAITEFMPHLRFGGSVFTLATLGLALAEDWPTRGEWLCDYGHYAMFYAMILPDGIGRIRALPNTNEPLITYRLTERDWRRLVQGAIKLAEALLAAGAEHIVPSIRGHGGWTRRSELRDNSPDFLLRELTSLMSIHLFASCPMGSDSDYYCTDSTGGLYGLENLSIADGSILPSAPGVNPQATIMALALRNADAFLAKPR